MNLRRSGVLMFSFSLCCLLASAQEKPTQVQPFSAATHYLSLPEYLRLRHHAQTGIWKPQSDFQWSAQAAHLLRSDSETLIDFGNLGAVGDVEAMNKWGLHLLAQSMEAFPTSKRYVVSWTFWFVVGEA